MHSEYPRPLSNTHNRHTSQILKVTGEATIQAAPDQAIITLGVHTENIDPKACTTGKFPNHLRNYYRIKRTRHCRRKYQNERLSY